MTRPESRPEYQAARIRRDVDLITAARAIGLDADTDHPREWNEHDAEYVDRCVATTDPTTGDMTKPRRLHRRTR